jgi:hypothetical protein
MTHRSLSAIGLFIFALALPVAASAQHGGRIEVPEVPGILAVEDGNVPFLQTRAYGTQNYFCAPRALPAPGVAWKLYGPQATLYTPNAPMQIATHFLSPNPEEQNTPRATWMHSHDGSAVWAALAQQAPSPAGSINWLLLRKVGTAEGPIGGSLFAQTTFIHRLNTEGGVAPASGCTTNDDLGKIVLVPYSTDYFFYRAAR